MCIMLYMTKGIHLFKICFLTTSCHKILHIGPLNKCPLLSSYYHVILLTVLSFCQSIKNMYSSNAPFFAPIYKCKCAQLIVINIKNKVLISCTSVSMDYHAHGMQRMYAEMISKACKLNKFPWKKLNFYFFCFQSEMQTKSGTKTVAKWTVTISAHYRKMKSCVSFANTDHFNQWWPRNYHFTTLSDF